ncbi:MAG TPA: hypothetical protein PLH33_00970, partial [Chitinophagaceae bacterium]|nr:hypothetical protein [Chitinophagaceae bacterium]
FVDVVGQISLRSLEKSDSRRRNQQRDQRVDKRGNERNLKINTDRNRNHLNTNQPKQNQQPNSGNNHPPPRKRN